MNLPNKITLSRIVLAFIFMFFLFSQGLMAKYLAFFTFCLASLTDIIDGQIARRRKLENDFGRLMDPIADKILVLAAFLAFVEMKIIPAWMDYWKISSLRHEAREKLSRIRPHDLGQAGRIPGISPADIAIVSVILKRGPD